MLSVTLVDAVVYCLCGIIKDYHSQTHPQPRMHSNIMFSNVMGLFSCICSNVNFSWTNIILFMTLKDDQKLIFFYTNASSVLQAITLCSVDLGKTYITMKRYCIIKQVGSSISTNNSAMKLHFWPLKFFMYHRGFLQCFFNPACTTCSSWESMSALIMFNWTTN